MKTTASPLWLLQLTRLCKGDGDRGKGHGREEDEGREGDEDGNGRGRSMHSTIVRRRIRSKGPPGGGAGNEGRGDRRTRRRLTSKFRPNELHRTASQNEIDKDVFASGLKDSTDDPKSTHWPMHGQRDSEPPSTHWPMHGQRDSRVQEGSQITDGRQLDGGRTVDASPTKAADARSKAPSAPSAASTDPMPETIADDVESG